VGGDVAAPNQFTLHCFAQSGNAYKPALMLQLAGADWTPHFVDYFGGETRTPAFREINVMGEAPVLVHNGATLTQSGVILDYLAETLGCFGAADAAERREVLRCLLWDNHKLTSHATCRSSHVYQGSDPAVLKVFRAAPRSPGACSTSRAAPLCRRRSPDHRRPLALRLSVLAEEIGVVGRIPWYPRLAGAHPRASALGSSLRADAGPYARSRLTSPDGRHRSRLDTRDATFTSRDALAALVADLRPKSRRSSRAAAIRRAPGTPGAGSSCRATRGRAPRPGLTVPGLSQLAAHGMYDDNIAAAGSSRHQPRLGSGMRHRLQRRDGQGRHLRADGQAPARPGHRARTISVHLPGGLGWGEPPSQTDLPDRDH
jgi:glutathione S-transferase